MKRALFSLAFSLSLFAQNPDVQSSQTFTTATTGAPVWNSPTIGAATWQLTFNATGFTAVTLQVETSEDCSGLPCGVWTAIPSVNVVQGTNPITWTSTSSPPVNTTVVFQFAHPWYRVNVTGVTGTGTITTLLLGYRGTSPGPLPGALIVQASPVGNTCTAGSPILGYNGSLYTCQGGIYTLVAQGGPPTGAASGVLSGNYPAPGFAANPTFTGKETLTGLSYPAVTITQHGAGGTTAYTYVVVGTDAAGGTRAIAGATATGNTFASLSGSVYNIVTVAAWSVTSPYVAPSGSCTVYRTVGGTSQGTIGTIASCAAGGALNDTGIAATVASVPADTSGVLATATPIPPPYLTLAALQTAHPTCDITLAYVSSAPAGQQLYSCSESGVWTQQVGEDASGNVAIGSTVLAGMATPTVAITQHGVANSIYNIYTVVGFDASGNTRTSTNNTLNGPTTPNASNYNIVTVSAWPSLLSTISYTSGLTVGCSAGQTVILYFLDGTTASLACTGSNAIAGGTAATITHLGSGLVAAPTTAAIIAGTATSVSGTILLATTLSAAAGTQPVGSCDVYREVGPPSVGKIGTIASCASGGALNDTGLAGDATFPPADTNAILTVPAAIYFGSSAILKASNGQLYLNAPLWIRGGTYPYVEYQMVLEGWYGGGVNGTRDAGLLLKSYGTGTTQGAPFVEFRNGEGVSRIGTTDTAACALFGGTGCVAPDMFQLGTRMNFPVGIYTNDILRLYTHQAGNVGIGLQVSGNAAVIPCNLLTVGQGCPFTVDNLGNVIAASASIGTAANPPVVVTCAGCTSSNGSPAGTYTYAGTTNGYAYYSQGAHWFIWQDGIQNWKITYTLNSSTGGQWYMGYVYSLAPPLTSAWGALSGAAGTLTTAAVSPAGTVQLGLSKTLGCTTGANATCGVATLNGSGTVTVSTTAIAALSTGGAGKIVLLSAQTCSNCGALSIGTVTAGTSFVINSTNILDASNVFWEIKTLQ